MGLSEKELQPGDHTYVRRQGILYSHHGIYVGDSKVIHYRGAGDKEKKKAIVRETSLEKFLGGGKLRRRDHKKRLPPNEIVKRARDLLGEERYSTVSNNCEHFATYCATGNKGSKQVKRGSSFAGVLAVGSIAILKAILSGKKRRSQ